MSVRRREGSASTTSFGVEFFGSTKPSADAECIAVATELLSSLGCGGLTVRLNSIGDPNCRPKYHEALKGYLHEHYDELCETCKLRLETNPLRVLDCKVEGCQKIANNAPVISDYLCDDCRDHQNQLLKLLDGMGIRYVIDPRLVRGLDYYTKTVFEITSESIGSQSAVCGGGRYDGLVEEIGGPHTPAVGFGLGMERLLLVLENTGYQIEKPVRYDLYIASMGAEAEEKAFCWQTASENSAQRSRSTTSAEASRHSSSMPTRSARATFSCSVETSWQKTKPSSSAWATDKRRLPRWTRRVFTN